jgi:hypothetical protein
MTPLRVELQLELDGSGRLVGTISDGTWTADLVARLADFRFSGSSLPCPYAGKYTLAILGNPDDWMRAGHGYATLKVDRRGNIICSGALADGTRFARSATVSADGEWPFFVPYRGESSASGWMTFTNQPDDDLNGVLTWLTFPGCFPGFCTNEFQAVGSRYEFPSDGSLVLDWHATFPPFPMKIVPGTAEFAYGGLVEPFTNNIALRADNRFVNQSDNGLTLKLNKSNGKFNGHIVVPGTTRKIPIQGALLRKMNAGYGYFLRANASGSVVLQGNE